MMALRKSWDRLSHQPADKRHGGRDALEPRVVPLEKIHPDPILDVVELVFEGDQPLLDPTETGHCAAGIDWHLDPSSWATR